MPDAVAVPVSPRENEVLDALADRLTNREIAERLVLSIRTVEAHVAALLRKFDAQNRRELAEVARERRLGTGDADGRLPAPLTRFVGRETELADLAAAYRSHRLVTLVGPAGVGKTRLAVEAARSMSGTGAALFADFAPRRDLAGLWAAVAGALGVSDVGGRPLHGVVGDRLAHRPALLVLDNCEHVLDASAELVSLLLDVPGVRVLATSRERLGIPGEQVVTLAPLPVPAADAATASASAGLPAVALFVDRARSGDAAFRLDDRNAASVASICRRLDGMPLALELAAAQLPALTPAQIDARLRDRFGLLRAPVRASTTRHQALDAAVAWSWDLLDPRERALLDRLSVFRGSFSLDAAEEVATGAPVARAEVVDLLVALVRKSLVVPQPVGDEHRYRLLETMREFGWRRLQDAGELETWRERHRRWMFGTMREAAKGLSCGVVPTWLDALDADLGNMEAALECSFATPAGAAEALTVVRSLEHYWMARGVRRAHGVRWSTMAAELAVEVAPAARVDSLLGAVLLVLWSDLNAAQLLADKATALADAEGDRTAIGYAALAQTWVRIFHGDVAGAAQWVVHTQDGISPQDAVYPWVPFAHAFIRGTDGHPGPAAALREVADEFRRRDDPHMYGAVLSLTADFDAVAGDHATAARHIDIAVEQAEVADCASCLSQAFSSRALLSGDAAQRLDTARRSIRLAHDIGEVFGVLGGLDVTVGALAATGALNEAAVLAGAARAVRTSTGMAEVLPGRAAALARGEQLARSGLGEECFAELIRDGARLDYASAVAQALG